VAEAEAKSMVAMSSLFETGTPQGVPHDEQNRTLLANSVLQAAHFAMTNFPLQSTAEDAERRSEARGKIDPRQTVSRRTVPRQTVEPRTPSSGVQRNVPNFLLGEVISLDSRVLTRRADDGVRRSTTLVCYHPK
jgi:hypothetical protein